MSKSSWTIQRGNLLGARGFSVAGSRRMRRDKGGVMQNRSCVFGIVMLMGVAVLALAGCTGNPGKVTGDGWIQSVSGNGKANFGFNGQQCVPGELKGEFDYYDQPLGVKMHSAVVSASLCAGDNSGQIPSAACGVCTELGLPIGTTYGIDFPYRSTNPKVPGEGFGIVCVTDNGEGKNAAQPDILGILIIDGPYSGYSNINYVQGGNIQSHKCTP